MAFPAVLFKLLPSVIGALGKIMGGDKGRKVEEAGQIVDEVSRQYEIGSLPPEKQLALKTVTMEYEQKLKEIALEAYRLEVQDLAGARDVIKTALRSEDPYVRRARPTFLWLMHVVIFVNYVIFPTLWLLGVSKQPFIVLPTALYYLFGSAFLGYSALRSADKKGMGLSGIGTVIRNSLHLKK